MLVPLTQLIAGLTSVEYFIGGVRIFFLSRSYIDSRTMGFN